MNLSISRILPAIHYEQGVKWGIKKSIRHTLTGIPAHQSLHPIVNSGARDKTQRHATYFRERTKWLNWQMIQPRPLGSLCIFQLAGTGLSTTHSHKSHWLRFVRSNIPWFMQTTNSAMLRNIDNTPPSEYLPEYWMLIFLFCSSSRWYCPCSGTETGPHYPVLTPCLSSHSVIHTGESHLSEISRIFSFAVINTTVVR